MLKILRSVGPVLFVALSACGGESKPAETAPPATTATPPVPATTAPAMSATPAPAQPGEAHRLMMLTSACWFGGTWSDGEGGNTEMRSAVSEARCHHAVTQLFGTDDKTKYEQLRAYDGNTVDDAVAKIEAVAKGDAIDGPRKDALIKVFRAVAAAKREETESRRAAQRVKRDLDKEPEKLSADEAGAVGALRATTALDALLKIDAGDLTADAHALGILSALDRMDIARGLPKHLKVYAVSGAYNLVFAVQPPAVPEDATKPLKSGVWLGYLTDTAKAAGHAIPDSAKTPKEKEPLAWGGVLEGFSDKLKADADKISDKTPLREVVGRIARRLDEEYTLAKNIQTTKASMPATTTTAKPAAPSKPPAPKK